MSVCARCPRIFGRSCCEVAQDEKLATLTRADVTRIKDARGLRDEAFVETEVLTEDVTLSYEQLRPLYEGYFRHGPLRLTLARRGGACVFHEAGRGCTLDATTRPTACRLYPFEPPAFEGDVSLAVERHGDVDAAARHGAGCLAVESSESLEALYRAFDTDEASVRALGQKLRQEVLDHARDSAPARSAGEAPGRRRIRGRT